MTEEVLRFPTIAIEDRAAARVGRGYMWVFSNEVKKSDPAAAKANEVAVFNEAGEFLGTAIHNPHALIRARLFDRRALRFDAELIHTRLAAALARRNRLMPGRTSFRLCFSEADGLPGLIVDKYGDVIVIQCLVPVVDRLRDAVVDALQKLLSPVAIVARHDVPAREHEGLPLETVVVAGELPEECIAEINGLLFRVDLMGGQKTGLFLDQADNWNLVAGLAKDRKVLDLFSNQGGFSLHAARAGATSVKAVDSSGEALSKLLFNAQRNGLEGIKAKESDAFQYVRAQPESFDLIVCDPPAFAKSRKVLTSALRGYRELNRQCLKMLSPGGLLLTCSCSAAVDEDAFDKMLVMSAKDAKRSVRLLPGGGQPIDHAPLLAMPETRYLKVRLVEVVE